VIYIQQVDIVFCVCLETRQECVDVLCDIQLARSCPSDSLLIEGFTPQGECCPTPSRCECQADRCAYNLCPPRTRRVLVRPGSNRPGSCCDEYQCIPQGNIVGLLFLSDCPMLL